jgi:hypothetical protein
LGNDMRQAEGKPYYEYWTKLFPQSEIKHRVHLLFGDECITDMDVPGKTQEYSSQQPSYETKDPGYLSSFDETVRAPLGYVMLGRGGDKALDCNDGFFVRHDDEWDWLGSVLAIEKKDQGTARPRGVCRQGD